VGDNASGTDNFLKMADPAVARRDDDRARPPALGGVIGR
jgi:hypothetical protein